jgi:methyl-accepting chemotaxis protein
MRTQHRPVLTEGIVARFNLSFKIGTKLAIMSGLGVALVTAMIASAIYGGAKVESAMIETAKQQAIAVDLSEAIASIRTAQVMVNEIRLAATPTDVLVAGGQLEGRIKTTNAMFDKLLSRLDTPANRARVEMIKNLFADYAKSAKDIAKLKTEILQLADGDASRKATLEEQLKTLVSDGSVAIASQMADMTEASTGIARESIAKADAEAKAEFRRAEYLGLGVGAFVIVILCGSAIFGVVSIGRPLAKLVPELKKLADGDFNVVVPGIGRKDEVGEIAEAAEMVADRVGATIVDIKMSASEVTNASAEISTSTTDLSQRSEEQAASLEETSASMEEMTATVKKNAENAKQASELASSTREVADRGGEVVAKTVEAMAKIEESSRKISDIIIVIDEIARQTNLLALNAAVEAARAGDAGRGFAVVASEVRSLAQRSSQAAKDIKDLITSSTGQVKDGVDLVNRAGHSLHEIVESIKKVTTVVTEIANASMEQSTGIEQINRALTQMDEMTQQNSALVEENAATAKTLEQQAKSMDERVAVFKVRGDARKDASSEAPAQAQSLAQPKTPIAVPRQQSVPPKRQPAQQPKRANGAARVNGHGGPVGRMQAGLAVALKEDDWKEF